MVRKRNLVVLVAALTAVGLAACVAVMASREDEEVRFDHIGVGMARNEVTALMGRPPDRWISRKLFGAGSWPPPPQTGVVHLGWNLKVYGLVWVWFDDAGRVSGKEVRDFKRAPTWWECVRRRLHL